MAASADDARADEHEILLALELGGRLSSPEIAWRTGLSRAVAAERLRELEADVRLQCGPAGTDLVSLSERGSRAAAAFLDRERNEIGEAVGRVLDEFGAVNGAVKDLVSRWQLRPVGGELVANDHRDERYDGSLLAELGRLLPACLGALAPLTALRDRYERYGNRLKDAVERAGLGEREYVSGLRVDSFHSIWWQLHADLLAVAGRARGRDDA